jgi:hypothetical protein
LAEGLTDARPEEQQVALVVRLVGTVASSFSSRIERWHQMRTRGGRR